MRRLPKILALIALLWPAFAWAVPSINQFIISASTANVPANDGYALAFDFGSAVPAGDTIAVVVFYSYGNGTTETCALTSVTDNEGNSYLTTTVFERSALPGNFQGAYALDVTNGPTSVTITTTCNYANTASHISAAVYDISNCTSCMLDFSGGYAGTFNSDPVEQTFAFTTNYSNEIGIAQFTDNGNDITSTSNWTLDEQTSGVYYSYGAHSALATSGSNSISATPASGSTDYGFYVLTFAPTSGSTCTHAGWTKSGTFAVPTAGTTDVWLKNGTFGTTDCSTIDYWQESGVWGAN